MAGRVSDLGDLETQTEQSIESIVSFDIGDLRRLPQKNDIVFDMLRNGLGMYRILHVH